MTRSAFRTLVAILTAVARCAVTTVVAGPADSAHSDTDVPKTGSAIASLTVTERIADLTDVVVVVGHVAMVNMNALTTIANANPVA